MEITTVLSWIGTCTGLVIGVPQIIKSIRTRKTDDVSVLTFLLIAITALCFLGRSVRIREPAFTVYYFFVLVSSSFQLLLIFRFRKKSAAGPV